MPNIYKNVYLSTIKVHIQSFTVLMPLSTLSTQKVFKYVDLGQKGGNSSSYFWHTPL